MMRVRGRRVWVMAIAAWLVGGAGVFAQDAEKPPEPAAPEPPNVEVELRESFSVDQKEGGAITHMPAVTFTKDGKRLVAGTSSGEIVIWDASNQKVLTRSSFAKGEIEAVVVSEDGEVLYTVLPTGELKAIDTRTGEARHSVELAKREVPAGGADANRSRIVVGPGPQSATQIALVAGKDRLVVVRGSSIEVRKASDLSLIKKVEKAHTLVTGLALDKTGRRVATVGQDGRLRIASLETLEAEREVKHAHPLYAVAFSPDGKTISFGGQEKKVYAVAVQGGEPVILSEKQPFDITALGYNHTGDVLAIGDESCDVWLLDVEAKAHLFHGKHHVECWLSSVAWAPDNETFLFGCRPNTHAGSPSLWAGNVHLEAAQSADVQASEKERARLYAELSGRYADKSDTQERARLLELIARRNKLMGNEIEPSAVEQQGLQLLAGGGATALAPGSAGVGSGLGNGSVNTIQLGSFDLGYSGVGWFMPLGAESALVQEQLIVEAQALAEASAASSAESAAAVEGETAVAIEGIQTAIQAARTRHSEAQALTDEQRKELAEIDKAIEAERQALLEALGAKDLARDLDQSVSRRAEAYRENCERIQGSFTINQWKVKKK